MRAAPGFVVAEGSVTGCKLFGQGLPFCLCPVVGKIRRDVKIILATGQDEPARIGRMVFVNTQPGEVFRFTQINHLITGSGKRRSGGYQKGVNP